MWFYHTKFVCSIILKQPSNIISCSSFIAFKLQAHSILESNSLFNLFFFFEICNILSQKPPFSILSSQKVIKKQTHKELELRFFVFIKFFIVLKLTYIKTFKSSTKFVCGAGNSVVGHYKFAISALRKPILP